MLTLMLELSYFYIRSFFYVISMKYLSKLNEFTVVEFSSEEGSSQFLQAINNKIISTYCMVCGRM